MKSLRNSLCNDLWNWLDSVSIKYKGYEIKNAIIAHKFNQYLRIMYNINHFELRSFLSSIKWKLKLNLLMSKIPNENMLLKRNYNSRCNLSNKNLYVINFSPNNIKKVFLYIAPLAESDNNSLVITVRKDVYDYFDKMDKPVILLDIYNPWRDKKDLEINMPLISSEKEILLSLDLFSWISIFRSASLIDLLDIFTNKQGLPQTLITLQDYSYFDSVFATYFLDKIPTVTLQHGKAGEPEKGQNSVWKYLISDWMVVFGSRQAEVLKKTGVNSKKIKVLGSAKYDLYSKEVTIQKKIKENRRILISVQHIMFTEKYCKQMYDFLKMLFSSKGRYLVSIRFHPSVIKKDRGKFVQKLKKMNSTYRIACEISNIKDALEDISESKIILTFRTTLGLEAMLLGKPVIEYLSSKRNNSNKFGDYRDFVLPASTGKDAGILIMKLLNDNDFYNKIIEKQNKFINSEIMPPPAIPRILDFINDLSKSKRGE